VAGRTGAPGYDPHYFRTLVEVEKRHFWYVARARLIRSALRWCVPDLARRALFDIGCGSGGLLASLQATGVPLAGACDAYPESLELVRRRIDTTLVLVDEGPLPPLGPGQSLLGLFDVLEHMDDDVAVLRFLASVLSPGGVLVLTVPAHPFLFDEMDEIAHHRRRYRRRELRDKLRAAGFHVRMLTHFMAPLVPALVLLRGAGRLFSRGHDAHARRDVEFRVVPVFNGAMRALLALEQLVLRVLPLPFGSSILAVAMRPGEGAPGANGGGAAL
jgi:SAM-dependent methyltransferase